MNNAAELEQLPAFPPMSCGEFALIRLISGGKTSAQCSRKRRKKKIKNLATQKPPVAVNAIRKFLPETLTTSRFRLLLAFVSSLIYLNSLTCGFVYDDRRAILENRNVRHSGGGIQQLGVATWLWRVFAVDDFWGTPIENPGSHKSWRPLVTLSFKLQELITKSLFDAVIYSRDLINRSTNSPPNFTLPKSTQESNTPETLHAFAYHTVNLLLHILVCDLVFQLAHWHWPLAFGPPSGRGSPEVERGSPMTAGRLRAPLACIAGALFVCHPVHVEAVTSLVGRAELMGALFALSSIRHMIEHLSDPTTTTSIANMANATTISLIKSILFATLACLSKENCTIILAFNILLALWFKCIKPAMAADARFGKQESSRCKHWRAIYAMLALMCAYSAARLAISRTTTTTTTSFWPLFSNLDNPLAQSGRQFCLRYARQLSTLIDLDGARSMGNVGADKMCADERVIGRAEQIIRMTRIYLPAFAFWRLLVAPTQLSYDWSLTGSGLDGPVESALEVRFLAALFTYALAAMFMVKWLHRCFQLLALHKSSQQRTPPKLDTIAAMALEQKQQRQGHKSKQKNQIAIEDHEDEASETSSVRSMDTLKSNDSGLGDESTSASTSPPRVHTPETAAGATGGSNYKENLQSVADSLDAKLTKRRWRTSNSMKRGCAIHSNGLQGCDATRSESADRHDFQIGWSLILLLLPYLPASNLLVPVGFLIAERTLYLPSVGFCLMATHVLDHLARRLAQIDLKLARHRSKAAPERNQQSATTSSSSRLQAARVAIVFPLVMFGAIATHRRNSDWRDERALFSSNLAQSPARSLANLATLEANQPTSEHREVQPQIEIYKQALELEPYSADLHYNLALALHRQALKLDAKQRAELLAAYSSPTKGSIERTIDNNNPRRTSGDPVAAHYKLALSLRPNFPLAALNLAAWHLANGHQLADPSAEAASLVESCAIGMEARAVRGHNQHVRAQIECLISGARIELGDFNFQPSDQQDYHHRQPTRRTTAAADDGEPEAELTAKKCASKVRPWVAMARAKIEQIGDGAGANEAFHQFGDLSKQKAQLDWLEMRCDRVGGQQTNRHLLQSSLKNALISGSPIEPALYLDCAAGLHAHEAIELLETAIQRERAKGLATGEQIAELLVELGRRYATSGLTGEALARIEQAIDLRPRPSANHLTFAGQLAYDQRKLVKSERLYERALAARQLEDGEKEVPCRRRLARVALASAHANYGAILQVNGRLVEAHKHYRRALDCDRDNRVAAANLERISASG